MNPRAAASLLVACVILLAGCGDDPEQPSPGQIKVVVVDQFLDVYLEDVAITLEPDGTVLETDENGVAVFDVSPGDYFIDAIVCCQGPAGRLYHVPVTVRSGETVEVILNACLVCV